MGIKTAGLLAAAGLLVAAAPAAAQSPSHAAGRGSILVGGSGSFSSLKLDGETNRSTRVTLRPSALYFVVPHVAVGGSLIFDRLWNDGTHSTAIGVGPSIGYFAGGPEARVLPFVRASGLLQRSTGGGDGFPGVTTSNIGFTASAGGVFLMSRHVGLSVAAYYSDLSSSTSVEGQGDIDSGANEFGVELGIEAFLF
jgi:hypothetical protein